MFSLKNHQLSADELEMGRTSEFHFRVLPLVPLDLNLLGKEI